LAYITKDNAEGSRLTATHSYKFCCKQSSLQKWHVNTKKSIQWPNNRWYYDQIQLCYSWNRLSERWDKNNEYF